MKTKFLRTREGKINRNYTIAEDGSYVRNKKTGEKEIPYINDRGDRVISIKLNGPCSRVFKVCHIQYSTWHGIIPKGYVIHHRDENKLNDHKDNHNCITKSTHNSLHNKGEKNPFYGTTGPMFGRTGEKHPRSKLLDSQLKEIKYFRDIKHWTQQKIANKFKISQSRIQRILKHI